jgi:hypothetical protein
LCENSPFISQEPQDERLKGCLATKLLARISHEGNKSSG